ncbi:MAG TPA: signal peptidase I, partial [Candidatus Stackebrandtia excrementipullorum]|nr:signal peptidase I [Candidatus Stackebrandtia excrementipullorum]
RRVRSHRRRHLPLLVELPLLLLVAFCAAVLLRSFVIQTFDIPSGSMEKTLQVGDRVLVNKLVYSLREPQRGEVVVFKGTDRWASEVELPTETTWLGDIGRVFGDLIGIAAPNEKDLVKRIIAVAGDTVSCCDEDGKVVINGVTLEESPYLYDDARLNEDPSGNNCLARRFGPVHVPHGHVFVMGDHRGDSKDSRCQGFVPVENFIGRAINVVWPQDHWSALDIPPGFADIPHPSDKGDDDRSADTAVPGVGMLAVFPLPLFRRHLDRMRIRREVNASPNVNIDSGRDRRGPRAQAKPGRAGPAGRHAGRRRTFR